MPSGENFKYSRTTALKFIAGSTVFTAVASTLGMLKMLGLAHLFPSIGNGLFSIHPYLQIFAFLSLFVMGVSYALIPFLRSTTLPESPSVQISFVSGIAGSAAYTAVAFIPGFHMARYAEIAGSILFLIAYLSYSSVLSSLTGFHNRRSSPYDYFFFLFPFAFITSCLVELWNLFTGSAVLTLSFLYLVLNGGVGSMIFAVTFSTSGFRLSSNRKTPVYICLAFQFSGIMAAFYVSVSGIFALNYLVSLLFMLSAISFIVASRSLEWSRDLFPHEFRNSRTSQRKDPHISYSEITTTVGALWLVAGTALGLLYSSGYISGYLSEIAYIHSIGIGFTGTFIMGYAPILFPGILGRKKPREMHDYHPVSALTAGLVLFVAGDIYGSRSGVFPVWAGPAGIIIIASIALFLYSTHKDLVRK